MFADSGYLIAMFNPLDNLHEKAGKVTAQLRPFRIVTTATIEPRGCAVSIGQTDIRVSLDIARLLHAEILLQLRRESAIYHQCVARNEAGLVRTQEHDGVGYVHRSSGSPHRRMGILLMTFSYRATLS